MIYIFVFFLAEKSDFKLVFISCFFLGNNKGKEEVDKGIKVDEDEDVDKEGKISKDEEDVNVDERG